MANEELWGEYAVGAFFIVLRFVARWHVVGFANFAIEDAFMAVALVTYTTITAVIHEITQYGAIIGQTTESVYQLTETQVASFTIGQKLTFVDWLVYLLYAWSLKATLLTLFIRLTRNLSWQTMMVRVVIGYTVVAFFGALITHICVCLPVKKSWQIQPYPGDACALRNLNYYLITFFNASSDVAIVAVPMPIIFGAKIPVARRVALFFLLCSGLFVAVAAVLRAYYSLKSLTTLPIAAGWTSRELFVAAVAVSIPGIKPLFSQSTWFRFRPTDDSTSGAAVTGGRHPAKSSNKSWTQELVTIGGSSSRQPTGFIETGTKGKTEWRVGAKEIRGHKLPSDGSSEDFILEGEASGTRNIHVTKEYEVSSDNRGSSSA